MPDQIEFTRPLSLTLPLSPGTRLGACKIVSRVGQGSLGTVYRAALIAADYQSSEGDDRSEDASVAMKVLLPHLTQCAETQRRFVKQMGECVALQHPNLVRILNVDQDGPYVYLTTEWLDGNNLAECVLNDGPIPPDLVYMIIRQVADGLKHAHENGIIHRDLKPQNIVLTSDGNVKVLDVGMALLRDEFNQGGSAFSIDEAFPQQPRAKHLEPIHDSMPREHQSAATQSIWATIVFTAPEQTRDPRNADARSDIFSLGCIAFFLLSGNSIQNDCSAAEVLRSKLFENDGPHQQLAAAPSAWLPVLKRMLAWNAIDRFDSMAELIHSLDELFDIDHRFTDAHQAKIEKLDSRPSDDDGEEMIAPVEPLEKHLIDGPSQPKPKSLWSVLGNRCRQVFGQR